MGRKSTIDNGNMYLESRQNAGLTREKAAELSNLSENIIERIERGDKRAQPDEVVLMAEAYKKPGLCNYYCSHECEIGKTYTPVVEIADLEKIVLNMVSKINSLEGDKNMLIDIAADGEISDNEMQDFLRIQEQLNNLASTTATLSIWVKQTIADGKIKPIKIGA